MKKLLIVAIIFAMLTPLVSCGQKTHFKFEKIRNANFREKTQFFAFNDLIYVIDRDKLVCMNPETGDMLESVNLPGYPTDCNYSFHGNANLFLIFQINNVYILKSYKLSKNKTYIKEVKSIRVNGSRFIDNLGFIWTNDFFIINEDMTVLSYYKNYIILDEKQYNEKTIIASFRGSYIATYNGQVLSVFAFNDKGFDDPESSLKWSIKSNNIDKCFISTIVDSICVCTGEKIFKVNLSNYKKTELYFTTKINSFAISESLEGYNIYGSEDGLYYVDDETSEPINISRDRLSLITHKQRNQYPPFLLAGAIIGNRYKLVCLEGSSSPLNIFPDRNKQVNILSFDDLPDGTFAVGLAKINYDLRVYAFTATGYYRSEVIFHDSHMEDLLKDLPSKKE